eukprot:CAMPEP_0114974080 /NCGR_PEP_ID=MMETSP0216-20121206/1323_1 /TAXON_ID=223996 /ORGANISM="Protocruzia adherens, Strain Boccale" /LENGTH=500 /DNA_ID=CAMNT_0002334667 /DNA_START=20 /DNA_END=1522 /DNA_ORIENTATION=+
MQAYEYHEVSEHLRDRHPYLEPPFRVGVDPEQVTVAVFDRAIPKLADVIMTELEAKKLRDALVTLNEMVSHQESKDDMINLGIIDTVSARLHHSDWQVRRAASILLGGLISVKQGRDQITDAFNGLQLQLDDDVLYVREAASWTVCRMAMFRDGIELLVASNTIKAVVLALQKFSHPGALCADQSLFILYLVETLACCTTFDSGIEPILGMNTITCLKMLLQKDLSSKMRGYEEKVQTRCLKSIANITFNHLGKDEGVDEEVILTARGYLDSEYSDQRRYSCTLIMSVAIHLQGKEQATWDTDKEGNPLVIQGLIRRLDETNEDIRTNAKQALVNLAELPESFLKITEQMADRVDLLDEIYSYRSVKPLSLLLPKLSDYRNAPFVDESQLPKYAVFLKSLDYFLNKYKESLKILLEETVNFAEKLLPFLNPALPVEYQVHHYGKELLIRVLQSEPEQDSNSVMLMNRFLQQYGDIPIISHYQKKSSFKKEIFDVYSIAID